MVFTGRAMVRTLTCVGSVVVVLAGGFVGVPVAAAAGRGPTKVPVTAIPHPDVVVYMDLYAGPDQISAVERRIRQTSVVRRFTFVDKSAALREFRRDFRHSPSLMGTVSEHDLTTSYRLELVQESALSRIERAFRGLLGVFQVSGPTKSLSVAAFRQTTISCNAINFDTVVFMQVSATQDQIDGMRDAIGREPNVTIVSFFNHDAAHREFGKQFAGNPDLISSISAADLSESFQLRVPKAQRALVQQDLRALPAVDEVAGPSELCRAVQAEPRLSPKARASAS
jgi:cell division protein FtsX